MNKGIILGLVALLATMAIASAYLLDGYGDQFTISVPEPKFIGRCTCEVNDLTGQVVCQGDNGCNAIGQECDNLGLDEFEGCVRETFGARILP